jgi:integrase
MRGTIDKRLGKRGPGYLVRVDLGADPVTGKRRQRAKTFATRREAEAALAQWLADIEHGTAIEPSKLTVRDYLLSWLETYGRSNLRPTTYRSYEQLVRLHILPSLGALPLQKLQPAHLQAFYAEKLKGGRADGNAGGLAPRTVRYLHAIIREALDQGVKWQTVARNAADATEPPRAERPHIATWDADHVRQFLSITADDTYNPLWLVLLTTGLRRGEALGLRWQDVDLTTATAHVRQSLVEMGGRGTIQAPKTASGRRVVALSPTCVTALREHRSRQLARLLPKATPWRDHDLIFTTGDGLPLGPRNVVRRFKALAVRAGVPAIRLHDTRHTHATLLLKHGVHAKIVSERLGHATIGITLDTYSHVLPDMQRQAADSIDAALIAPLPAAHVNNS